MGPKKPKGGGHNGDDALIQLATLAPDMIKAFKSNNVLLEKALERMDTLEAEIKTLREDNVSLKLLLRRGEWPDARRPVGNRIPSRGQSVTTILS